MGKIKSIKPLIMGVPLLVFSFGFANDGVTITPANENVKIESKIFDDDSNDGIISGRKEAVKKTAVIFQYADNSVYQIYSKPNYLTTIKLQPGEKIIFKAGGDTENWQLEQTTGGKDNQEILLLVPTDVDLKTNLVITTDRHTYLINVVSTEDKYNPLVEWQYPQERKLFYENYNNNTESLAVNDIKNLNYGYTISNKKYNFSPNLVFDDGTKTYILMKNNLQEMPSFYVKGADNQLTLVTSRVEGRYVVLDYVTDEIYVINGTKTVKVKNNKNRN